MTCTLVVNSATSIRPAIISSTAVRSGAVFSGKAHWYTGTALTWAPRSRKPSSSSAFETPYSCTATFSPRKSRLLSSITRSTSCQVFGSGAGEKDHRIDFSFEQRVRKFQSFNIGRERNLPHCWRVERLPAVRFNQTAHFLSTPALERQDSQSLKICDRHLAASAGYNTSEGAEMGELAFRCTQRI